MGRSYPRRAAHTVSPGDPKCSRCHAVNPSCSTHITRPSPEFSHRLSMSASLSGGGTATVGCRHSAIHGIPASNTSCGYGGAAHSADNGSTWVYATKYWSGLGWTNNTRTSVAYDYDVLFTDGTTLGCIRREEPKLLIEGGLPTALITQCTVASRGRTEGPYPKAHPNGEVQWLTRLVVQPINAA